MQLWKILFIINLVSWYLPVPKFRRDRYFTFFLVNSIIDPIYVFLTLLFHFGFYNYLPLALLLNLLTFPEIEFKSRIILVFLLSTIILTLGSNVYFEFIVCELVLFIIIFNLLQVIASGIINESSVFVFQLLLLIYYFRNFLFIYLYYQNQNIFLKDFSLLLFIISILPLLIMYYGPNKKITIDNKLRIFLLQLFKNNKIVKNDSYTFVEGIIKIKGEKIFDLRSHSLNNAFELSKREKEILELIQKGMTSQEVADKLYLSKRTVDNHRTAIRQKLGLPSDVPL